MALYEQFPYTNFHELNLADIMADVKNAVERVDAVADDIQGYVNEYLDRHPEIVIQDGSVTERKIAGGAVTTAKLADGAVTADKIDETVGIDYVTPQMYKTASNTWTEAFQAAVDSGQDVMIPTCNGEIYDLSEAFSGAGYCVLVPNTCKRIFGNGGMYRGTAANLGGIVGCSTLEAGSLLSLFRLADDHQGFTMANLRLILGAGGTWPSTSSKAGVMLDAATSPMVDKDVAIVNVSITRAYIGIDHTNRGLLCNNVLFGACMHAARINATVDDAYMSRGIWFNNCRFHSMTGDYAVRVESGHAYGFKMTGCLADHYLHGLLYAAEAAYNWTICNNTVERAYRISSAPNCIYLAGGAGNCIISGNVFRSMSSETYSSLTHFILAQGDINGLVINGNVFDTSHRSPVQIEGGGDTSGVVISNNSFIRVCDVANSTYAAIRINNNSQSEYCITGNTIGREKGSVERLLAASSVGQLTYSTITGNACGSIPAAAYDSATCSLAGNVTWL